MREEEDRVCGIEREDRKRRGKGKRE
jgi:hypothetical protein